MDLFCRRAPIRPIHHHPWLPWLPWLPWHNLCSAKEPNAQQMVPVTSWQPLIMPCGARACACLWVCGACSMRCRPMHGNPHGMPTKGHPSAVGEHMCRDWNVKPKSGLNFLSNRSPHRAHKLSQDQPPCLNQKSTGAHHTWPSEPSSRHWLRWQSSTLYIAAVANRSVGKARAKENGVGLSRTSRNYIQKHVENKHRSIICSDQIDT